MPAVYGIDQSREAYETTLRAKRDGATGRCGADLGHRDGVSSLKRLVKSRMDQISKGLSQVQQNNCRAALAKFIDRHDLFDWESTVNVEETSAGQYCVKIELTPPAKSGLAKWTIDEIAVANASVDVAAEVDKLLESGYQARLSGRKVLERQ
jgi:hypothetical protein